MKQDANGLPWCPALGLAFCFGIGIRIEQSCELHLFVWAGATCLAVAALIIPHIRSQRRLVDSVPLVATASIMIVVLSAGGMRAALDAHEAPDSVVHLVPRLANQDVIVDGRVASPVQHRETGARFVIALERIGDTYDGIETSGRLQVYLSGHDAELKRGQRIRLAARMAALPRKRNPADFDYGTFLRRQGITGILYADEGAATIVDARRSWLYRTVDDSGALISDVIRQHVRSDGGRMVLQALLLGDRSSLTPEDREHLARSGLMHLLAVSGLHVLLVGMVLYRLLRPMLLRFRLSWKAAEWTRTFITMLVLCFYMLLTGSTPSVVRAVIMAALFIGATLAQRPVHSLNTLGAAGLIILLIDPNQLLAAGFQLSFSAVGAIILFSGLLRRADNAVRKMPRAVGYVTSSVMVSLAATLGTMPVLLFHFGRASVAGLALNVLAIPATFGVLASGLLMSITHPLSGTVAANFGAAADVLANLVLYMARIGDGWSPVALIEQRVQDGWWIAAIIAATVAIALIHHHRIRWRMLTLTLCFVTIATWSHRSMKGSMEIIFFDVGQGDAALVRTPSGKTMLIDAGPRTHTFDAGARILDPNLAFLGIKQIHAVVISHPHSDHLGGLPHLLRSMPVGAIYHNGERHESRLFDEVQHLMESLSIDHNALSAGDVIELDQTVHVKVLAPVSERATSINDASVVLRITHGDVSILMTGDAEAQSEGMLSRYYPELLSSTLIKAGHHGSSTSSTSGFVSETRLSEDDGLVVVSVAERNRYRHPSAEVLSRWTGSGRSVHLTSESGAVWFRSDGRTLTRVDWK